MHDVQMPDDNFMKFLGVLMMFLIGLGVLAVVKLVVWFLRWVF